MRYARLYPSLPAFTADQAFVHALGMAGGACDCGDDHDDRSESVARHLGVEPLNAQEIDLEDSNWRGETPLWSYVLREAAARTGGHRLGPVGGRIVADVLIGLLKADDSSFINTSEPRQPEADADQRGIAQLLSWAERAQGQGAVLPE